MLCLTASTGQGQPGKVLLLRLFMAIIADTDLTEHLLRESQLLVVSASIPSASCFIPEL